MRTSRRHFLQGMGAFTGTLLLGASPLLAAPEAKPVFQGKLYGLGANAKNFYGQPGEKSTDSILSEYNLETQEIKQSALKMARGHAAMAAGDGRILCVAHSKPVSILVDKEHAPIKTFTAPDNYLYSGHGLIFKDRNLFILPLRFDKADTIHDTGKFEVYDLTTLQKLDMVDSGGIQPHEVHIIPGHPDELAITHYGSLHSDKNDHTKNHLEYTVLDSKLSILDSHTFKTKRQYLLNDFNAAATHMRVDKDGWAYIVLSQYVDYISQKELKPGADAKAMAIAEAEKIFKQKLDFPMPPMCDEERHIAVSLPFLRINTQTGEREVYYLGDKYQMYPQSVAYNHAMDTGVGTFYYSNDLVLHTPGKPPELLTGEKLKLRGVRGVTEIPGTNCIAVCGSNHDVAIVDLKTRDVVARFLSENFSTTHIYHNADI